MGEVVIGECVPGRLGDRHLGYGQSPVARQVSTEGVDGEGNAAKAKRDDDEDHGEQGDVARAQHRAGHQLGGCVCCEGVAS